MIVVFQNKPTYGGVTNKVENLLNLLSATVLGANKQVTLKRYRLATPPTGGTWIDVSANSIMEYSLNTTADITTAELILPISLAKVDQFYNEFQNLNFRSLPDDYIAYVINSTGSSDITISSGWKELSLRARLTI